MRGKRTLRFRFFMNFLLAALVPITIFAIISQINIQKSIKNNLTERIDENLRNSSKSLDMILDKYTTILYDLCTDEEILESVSGINKNEDILEVNSSILRRKLSHICNQDIGIEGITIQTMTGKIIFYDRLNSSSIHSGWVDEIEIPEVEQGEVYCGESIPIEVKGQTYYMLRIARNLIDYKDIRTSLGTIVFSINEERIKEAISSDVESSVYLLSGDTIISAPDSKDIGKDFRKIEDESKNRYTKMKNEKSGFIICNVQPLKSYTQMIINQWAFLVVIMKITIFITILFIYFASKPYLKAVADITSVMNQVEKGEFHERVSVDNRLPIEIHRIAVGFNEMIIHIEELIEKVKQAVLEQKNAELSAMEAQIDPHFLYNTLDTINWKAIEKEEYEISEMVGALADILRYTVRNSGGTASIAQEIAWLRQYIMLQSAKLGKKLNVKILVPEELEKYRIHKLLIQPFVENAIKYAFVDKEDECVLEIIMRQSEDQIHILIADNGNGMEPDMIEKLNCGGGEMEGHLGINNVRKRLKLYYDEQAAIYFESEVGSYTKVHLFVPAKEENTCES